MNKLLLSMKHWASSYMKALQASSFGYPIELTEQKRGVSKLEDFPNFDTPCYGMHRSDHRDSNRVTPQG